MSTDLGSALYCIFTDAGFMTDYRIIRAFIGFFVLTNA
jgi:hypothetical protein